MDRQIYYKIFSPVVRGYWTQDKSGYTENQSDAGWWSEQEIECMKLGREQKLVPYRPSPLALQSRELDSGWAL